MMIEELDALRREVQLVACEQVREWLASSDSPDIKPRLNAVAKKIDGARRKIRAADVSEVLFNRPYDLEAEVLKFDSARISEALAKVNGKVTHAADLVADSIRERIEDIRTRARPPSEILDAVRLLRDRACLLSNELAGKRADENLWEGIKDTINKILLAIAGAALIGLNATALAKSLGMSAAGSAVSTGDGRGHSRWCSPRNG